MKAKETLSGLAVRLRESAMGYREKANSQDRHACSIEILAALDEDRAAVALKELMKSIPQWFAN